MKPIIKWLGLGFGWTLAGPIGSAIGFAIGYYFDNRPGLVPIQEPKITTPGDFMMSLLVLTAAVMKADGSIKRMELNFVKDYLHKTFDKETANSAQLLLRDILKEDISIHDVCLQISQNLDYSSRLQLLHYLFGISSSDNEIHPDEVKIIKTIAQKIGLEQSDFKSTHSSFLVGLEAAYEVLGVSITDDPETIKAAYRNMANKYHPDKVAYLGDDFKLIAQDRFRKLSDAYEQIKKQQGFN